MDSKDGTRHGNPVTAQDKHPELNTFLDDIRDAGMAVTKRWMDMWQTAIQYAWGQQLQNWKLNEDWEYVIVNRIYPLMFQTIAKLAGNHPKIMATAWDDEKEGATEFAENWAGHLQYLWESPYELNMRLKLVKGLLDCAVFGYMVGYTHWETKPKGGWDDTQKQWTGKCDECFVHPALFWTDPSAETLDKAENCGTKRRVKLEWAVNRWPQYKDDIEAQAFTAEDPQYAAGDLIAYKDQKGSTLPISRQKMFSKMVGLILDQGTATGTGQTIDIVAGTTQKYVNIEQIYWNDYQEKKVKIEDNVPKQELIDSGRIVMDETTGVFIEVETGEPLKDWPKLPVVEYDQPLYPNGRFVLRIARTILNPGPEGKNGEEGADMKEFAPDQVYKESRWPFTIMPYHILPHMWQGGNAVEQNRNNNDFLNITISSMVQQVRRTADPTKIIEAGALAKGRDGKIRSTKDMITGLGRIIVAAKGKLKMIGNLEYPKMDASTMILADTLRKDIDAQEFMQPIARGETEGPKKTKAEALTMNQNALDYVGLQGIFLDKFIDDTATLVAELCQRNYDPGRMMNIISDEVKKAISVNDGILDVRLDVNIEPGSTLPFDEIKKQNEYATAYKMLENPIPNPMIEDMLRILNISKRAEILEKYQGLQLFRQFVQMGAMLNQMQGDPEVQAVLARLAAELPGMKDLLQLLVQAGQLAPQTKGATQNVSKKSQSEN